MTIKKSFVLFFLSVVCFSFWASMLLGAQSVEAKVVITEIMYDDEGSDVDWVEIYNDGEEIDVTSLKLLISNSTSNHAIKGYLGTNILGSEEYGLIVVNSQATSFVDKWGSVGNIFTSSFSLPNVAGEQTATVELNAGDKSVPIDSVTYEELLGSKGDGNSLQLIDGSWKSSLPTPGQENIFNSSSSEEGDSSDEGESEDDDIKVSKAVPKISAKVFAKSIVFAGEPITLRTAILENGKEAYYRGKYHWNFGDGSFLFEMNRPEKQKHVYYYPGDYALFMKYYPDVFTEDPQFEARMNIKAVPVEVSIKNAGIFLVSSSSLNSLGEASGYKDFRVELANDSAYEIDISAWSIIAGRKFFQFPPDSVILPKKSLTISGRITGFVQGDEKDLKLYSSTGEIISKYQR